jgi:PadR family transcriptional regulator, regulatory protein PadR
MASDRLLGGFEHLLLLAILRLEDDAYGATIRRELIQCAHKDVAVGAIYTGLDRLEEKGFVESWMGEPTAKRGGRGKRLYRVTSGGRRALAEMDRAVRQLSAGLRSKKGTAHARESTTTPRGFTHSLLVWQSASASDSW